jgi:hypothetical protein
VIHEGDELFLIATAENIKRVDEFVSSLRGEGAPPEAASDPPTQPENSARPGDSSKKPA